MDPLNRTRGTTRQHRGLRSYIWTWRDTLSTTVLLVVAWSVVWLTYDAIQSTWQAVLAWAWPRLGIGPASAVGLSSMDIVGRDWPFVSVALLAPEPDRFQRWATLVAILIMVGASLVLPRRHLPTIYFLRALAALCALSLAAYVFVPQLQGVDANGFFNDLLKIGGIMLWVVPVLHAVLLYIFPLHALEKLLGTVAGVAFIAISTPFQVGAMAWFLTQTSTLMLLPLYLLGTFLPPVLAQIGIYAYFVSRARVSERRGLPRPELNLLPTGR